MKRKLVPKNEELGSSDQEHELERFRNKIFVNFVTFYFSLMLLFLLFVQKGDNHGLSSFADWNWISVFSLAIFICLVFLLIFQFCFKSRTIKYQPKSFMDSSIFLDSSNCT